MADENKQQETQPVKEQPVQQASNDKKSKAPLIIIAVVLVLVVGAVGFFLLKGSLLATKGISGQVLNANCRLNDKDLCKFMSSFKGLENMSAKTVTTVAGKKNESTMEVQGTDKSHIITSVEGKEEYNIIMIGNTTYTKDYTDNKWWKSTTESSADTGSKDDWNDEFEKSVNDTQDKTTYKKIGKEACGNLTCLKYQVIDPSNTETTEYIWFDTKKYSLRKMRSEAKDGVVTETTFTYDKVNIAEPSPTKDMTDPAGAFENMINNSANSGAALNGLSEEQARQLEEAAAAAANDLQLETQQ